MAARVSKPLSEAERARFEIGKATYESCAACHQPDGRGRVAVAPSLVDGRWANADTPEAAIRILLHGKEGSSGFAAPMVPLGALSDEHLAGVLTFMRRSWGNNASAVEPGHVAQVRRAAAGRLNAWSDTELAKTLENP